ncbi:hypothetical protein [Pseudorhodoplanes sinuspersici]|uniref:Uncharacterized protein n=1 Tax=Pseudorhodoplanes sinuspersici TaxID=1235591 RepID=A0A1W6ZWY4_9HYPH|nr:hypothetical protein [Pseudorhodoplanes sinuspersici]ARQ01907.1 hypothetical protein CAK95_24515 [Pseudorhodoplanes sinuspersici]RKE73676.1 hypothetical protein DFP91_1571 [Pseudorhodoplanes sinuspersici]
MSAYKFKKSQCVTVPATGGVQGRISGRSDFVDAPNAYKVSWLNEKLQIVDGIFTEQQLVDAGNAAVTGGRSS